MERYFKKKMFEGSNKKDLEFVKNALDTVGMKGFEKRSFSSLSGGEKQRILIARAIVQETEVLVLDEPTNRLDIGSQIKTLKLLKKSNKTILTALHDLNIAARYCDRIFIIYEGKIIRSGKPKDILDKEIIRTLYDIESEVVISGDLVNINYL
ncbi:MAG: ABC transporter ATP-binding protein [Paraclostridium sp.]